MTTKLTHSQAQFHTGHHGSDSCGRCKSFIRENLCKKVLGPMTQDDWCAVGQNAKTGKLYDPNGPKLEKGLQSFINRKKGQRNVQQT